MCLFLCKLKQLACLHALPHERERKVKRDRENMSILLVALLLQGTACVDSGSL